MGLFDIFSTQKNNESLSALESKDAVMNHLKEMGRLGTKAYLKTDNSRNYKTAILTVTDKHLFIAQPSPAEGLQVIQKTPDISISYRHNSIYHLFKCKFLSYTGDKNFPVATTIPKSIARMQRRKHLRVMANPAIPVNIDVYINVSGVLKSFKQKIYDISERGFSFYTTIPANLRVPGQKIKVDLILKDGAKVTCDATIVHNAEMDHGLFTCGTRFENLSDSKSSYLKKYVAERKS